MPENDLRERLADVSHEIWCSWMRWMFKTGTLNADGTWTMPAELVQRWHRQMFSAYFQLTEREKDSDREQADKLLAVINPDPVYSPQFLKEHTEMIQQLNDGTYPHDLNAKAGE